MSSEQLAVHDYIYNDANQITDLITENNSVQYFYDDDNRLREILSNDQNVNSNESFTFDKAGNRLTEAGSDAWVYNGNNQLTIAAPYVYSYNTNGNRVTKQRQGSATRYSYNTVGRLSQIEEDEEVLVSYQYDPFGRRLSKTIQGTITYFLYNDTGLVGEYDANGDLVVEYFYWPSAKWGTNPMLQRRNSRLYYYYNDHIGTPQKILTSTGQIVWSANYDLYGSASIETEIVVNNLRYPGQYFDAEADLHYNWQRYYDPRVGRYIESNPTGITGGVNYYIYANSNPVSFFDTTGEVGVRSGSGGGGGSGTMGLGGYATYNGPSSGGTSGGKSSSTAVKSSPGKPSSSNTSSPSKPGGSTSIYNSGGKPSGSSGTTAYGNPSTNGGTSNSGSSSSGPSAAQPGNSGQWYNNNGLAFGNDSTASALCSPGLGGFANGPSLSLLPGRAAVTSLISDNLKLLGIQPKRPGIALALRSDPKKRFFNDVLNSNAGDATREISLSNGVSGD